MTDPEVVIIGAGPAGITAAIQLKRYGIPVLLLEKDRVGGLLWNANLVENYPGFPSGVSGPKLAHLMEKQMERIGVDVTFDSASHLSLLDNGFYLASSRTSACSRYVIIASGTKPKPVPLPIPPTARHRVFSDVVPLLEVQNRHILIVGAGDAAFDHAINLTKNRNSVTILNRGRQVKCLSLLKERADAIPSIEVREDIRLSQVDVDETASRLIVQSETGERFEADYLIFAIGRDPQLDFLSAELTGKNVEGLYFVGDVQNGLFRQAAIAAGDGLKAAMRIYHQLIAEA